MNDRRHESIDLEIEGLGRHGGLIPLGSFRLQLQHFHEALNLTDRLVSGYGDPTARYRVASMRQESPARITIEARPKHVDEDYTPDILDGLVGALLEIDETGQAPRWVDRDLLERLRKLNSPIGSRLRSSTIRRNGREVALDRELRAKIDVILAPVESFDGFVKGHLEAINLHESANNFRIYPVVGPNRVTCHFPEEMRGKAVQAVDETVVVYGELQYKANAPFPDEIDVDDMEVIPPDDELPSLSDLRGAQPDATGGKSSVEFVREVRDEWE